MSSGIRGYSVFVSIPRLGFGFDKNRDSIKIGIRFSPNRYECGSALLNLGEGEGVGAKLNRLRLETNYELMI